MANGGVQPSQVQHDVHNALNSEWARRDRQTFSVALLLHVFVLWRSPLLADEWCPLATTSIFMAALLVFNTQWHQLYLRCRTPLLTCFRSICPFIPVLVFDPLRALQPAAEGGGTVQSTSVATYLYSAMALVSPLAWVDGCAVAAVGNPLPPLLHAMLQISGVGLLMRRAPTACSKFVALNPSNRWVTRMAYWALDLLASLLCVGTREHLAAAGVAASGADQCTAVVWSLEASLGLVLPTLVIWRQHLAMLRQTAGRRLVQAAEWESGGALLGKHYMELQLLETASCASWPLATVGAALVGFIAGVLRHS